MASLADSAYITASSAESKVIGVDQKTGEYIYVRDTFANVGIDNYNNPPSQNPDMFELLNNIQPVTTGGLTRRWGSSAFANPGLRFFNAFDYQNDSNGDRYILLTAYPFVDPDLGILVQGRFARIKEDGSGYTSIRGLGTTGTLPPRVLTSRDSAYLFDGVAANSIKWNSVNGVSTFGIVAPTTPVSVSAPVAGAVTLLQGRKYYGAFRNSVTGHTSDLNPVSATTGPVSAQNIPLVWAETTTDPQVDRRIWLATADGGDETTLYLLADTAMATTSLTDNVTEDALLLNELYLETDDFGTIHGIADNAPPPILTFPVKHKGRLWGVNGQNLFFSKNQADVTTSNGFITSRYEECWPAENTLDIAEGTETVRGLLSDGDVLYVGTERHIRKLAGDSPDNFSKPEVAFNNVGLANQDVWKIVFYEGAPVGSIWLTPDLRLIASDFNVYRNIGTPVQATLNSINLAAMDKCRAMFGSTGAYDLYILAVPTGNSPYPDTLLVYQIATKKFFIWQIGIVPCMLYFDILANGSPLWLYSGYSDGRMYKLDSTRSKDSAFGLDSPYTVQARTSWLHLGDPAMRKVLNELEVTGDPTMTVTIEGASTDADFNSPAVIVSNAPLVTSPFGQLKLYLASYTTKYRFYRFTFTGSASTADLLDAYSVSVIGANRL